jgi:hypothetical protein
MASLGVSTASVVSFGSSPSSGDVLSFKEPIMSVIGLFQSFLTPINFNN